MDTPSTSTSQETATAHSKRNRVQLSCTPCRHAKLKCDRAQPCSQCQKKDRVGSCSYPTPLPRKKAAMTMHKRLKHLESLVKDVMNSQQSDGPHTPPRDGQEPENLVARAEALGIPAEDQRSNTAGNSLSSLDKSSTIQQTTPPPGQVVIGGKETQYVGATHWAAILNDIGEVREYFDEGEDDDVEEETGPETTLLFNTDAPPTKAKLLAALPARRVVDRTVQGYFHGANPALRLHRDPDRVGGQITPFQGEMRRRLWAVLRQIDLLSSFHIGLPSMVESVDSDVQLPRNLNDSDFDEDCTELPPPRPDSEVTSISYVRFKNKICQVFGKIATLANSLSPPSYDEIMELDSQLDAVQATIPPSFRFQPIDSCVADPAQLIIQRLNIAHLLCKSRCVLHRKYIVSNQDYLEREYSVNVSIDAAMQLLDLQKQTYEATQPGGVLARDRCFPSSLTMHDFLLAAMIVYMKTMRILEEEIRESSRNGLCLGASCRKRKLDMISALKTSSDSWQVTQMRYPEFKWAADVLSVMMRKIGTASVALGESQISWGMNSGTNDTDSMAGLSLEDRFTMNQATTNPLEALPWSINSSAPAPNSSCMNLETTQPIPHQTDSLNESAPFDSLMDIPTDFDWELFDSHIRADTNQLPMHDQHLPDIDLGVEGMNGFEFGFV